MRQDVYHQMASTEDDHWWFVARRRILAACIAALPLPKNATILEAGCGTGGNLAMLARFGTLHAFEYNPEALKLARKRGIGAVESGHLPEGIPFGDTTFDLIALLDVLEHLENDVEALTALKARLAPEGRLLLAVPAFQFLWSAHDTAHHHFRRYTLRQIKSRLKEAGFTVTYATYFNFFLFPPIALARLLLKDDQLAHHQSTPSGFLNDALRRVFALEAWFLPRLRFPFGVSIMAVAKPR